MCIIIIITLKYQSQSNYNCDIYFMKIKCCKTLGKDRNGFCLWNTKGLLLQSDLHVLI